jgi:hypothetical protein
MLTAALAQENILAFPTLRFLQLTRYFFSLDLSPIARGCVY